MNIPKETWYVYFDKYTEKKMGAVCSRDLINWTDISDKVSFPDGMRHGTVIEVEKKIIDQLLTRQNITKLALYSGALHLNYLDLSISATKTCLPAGRFCGSAAQKMEILFNT